MLYNLKNKIVINLDKFLYAERLYKHYLRIYFVGEQTSIEFDTEEEVIEAMIELGEATKNV